MIEENIGNKSAVGMLQNEKEANQYRCLKAAYIIIWISFLYAMKVKVMVEI